MFFKVTDAAGTERYIRADLIAVVAKHRGGTRETGAVEMLRIFLAVPHPSASQQPALAYIDVPEDTPAAQQIVLWLENQVLQLRRRGE